jgi:ATP phosphoribosyltransferase
MEQARIRIAIQKSGRLSDRSMSLLERCGLDLEWDKNRLFSRCGNFPLDLMLLRDDDIPEYINDGVCDLGVVGFNVLQEKILSRGKEWGKGIEILRELDFGTCRLSLAIPVDKTYGGLSFFNGLRIATSYPATLRNFLTENKINAEIIEISGSVEIAPALKIAEAICDLVSSGTTLRSNGLKEVERVLESQSVLVTHRQEMNQQKTVEINRLLQRVDSVRRAAQTKYVMLNASRKNLTTIRNLLPGLEEPTIMPLGGDDDRIAVHAVSHENIFWETMEKLKLAGASSILVLPIEKIIL